MSPRVGRTVASGLYKVQSYNVQIRAGLLSAQQMRCSMHHEFGRKQQWKQRNVFGYSNSRSSSSTPQKPDHSETVRKLMRHVPHPVAIVTAAPKRTADTRTHASHWRGATISSFVTVALNPEPIICFNIKHNSSTFATLEQSSHFNVHLLRSGPEAEAIATKFASGNALEPFHDGEGELEWWVREPVAEEGSAPVIEGNPDELNAEGTTKDSVVSFRLSCVHVAEKTVAVGDHVVVFGRVTDVVHGLETDGSEGTPSAPCLLYVEGGYSRAAGR